MKAQGPLQGVKVIEFVGLGPAPFCAMHLADLGAEVIRIDRPGAMGGGASEVLARGRRSASFNLKKPESLQACLALVKQADILLEGFRPGVMERLGLGPEVCLKANPKLVFGRMTGWGQSGPLAHAAGHDLNYIALTGALEAIGPKEKPVPPLNVVGDFGGGSLYLATGVLAALLHARETGEGQVVDTAIVDGATHLMAAVHQLQAMGLWTGARGENLLDGGAPFYDCYECADGKFVSIAPLEPEFYAILVEKLELGPELELAKQYDATTWPHMRTMFEKTFKAKPRAHWDELLEGSDACYAPVLTTQEAAEHPHMKARGAFGTAENVLQPEAAPRFSLTPASMGQPGSKPGEDTTAILSEWGLSDDQISDLKDAEAIV